MRYVGKAATTASRAAITSSRRIGASAGITRKSPGRVSGASTERQVATVPPCQLLL
nr:hypothetical protein [Rhodovulum sp.]